MTQIDTLPPELETVRDCIRWVGSEFSRTDIYFGHGTDNAMDEASQLVLQTLGFTDDTAPTLLDGRLTAGEKQLLYTLVRRRIDERIPLPYLTGKAWFAGLEFKVNEQVLIPRSPLAELIEQGFQPWLLNDEPGRILDLCTGSGCIGIACALYFEGAQVHLADISAAALEVAATNIDHYELAYRVRCQKSDLFDGLVGEAYDLIVSNPPYVDSEDLAEMPLEYSHEPALALGSGQDGLDITRRILRQAAEYLTPMGLLVVEVGNSGMALEQAFPSVPFTWLEFQRGGHGVFVFTREELLQYQSQFSD